MSIKSEGKLLYNETRQIIRKAKENNRLVLFVGAGASMDSGMPSWGQAIDQIAKRLPLSDMDKSYDSLKIPQFYYNSRGKKEYTQLMRDIFLCGKPLKTTKLHKRLIECQADIIITTNYDHLIEQASEENAEVRYVISKDSDLPYKNTSRELIKMHGDFENDNFVLKEDDYLQYSANFKLVETYIKSLIGSKVVVFIGYSLNDPDVKQILTWVKDVLKEDFQRSYLILSNTERSEIERDYFKNLGVNIIYTSEIIENWDNKSHTDQLVEFFDYILEDEEEKLLDRIYKELKPFQELNYVYGKYIRNALIKINISCEDSELDLSSRFTKPENDDYDRFKEILWVCLENENIPEGSSISSSDWHKLKAIKNVIKKSCFKTARREIDRKNCRIKLREDIDDSIEKYIYCFDYKSIYELKTKNAMRLATDSPMLYMQQAFICALLNDYYSAYNCLKNASKIFYRTKDYTWYFLAEFNRKYVGKVCMHPFVAPFLTEEERMKLETEVKSIDIDRILETIPELGHNHNEFLKELGNFKISYTLFYDMFSDSIKANEEAKTAYSFFSGTAAYEKLRRSATDYNYYETNNYIILDRYNEVRSIFLLYLRSIVASVMSEDISSLFSDKNMFSSGNVKQDKLTDFDFYIMLRYLTESDLRKLVNEYDVKVFPCTEEALEYIDIISDSIFLANNYVKNNGFSQDVFWTYLELISHINISEKLAISVLNHFKAHFREMNLLSNRDCVNRFIVSICKEKYYQCPEIAKSATKILDYIFESLVVDTDNFLYFSAIIINLLYICKQSGKPYDDVAMIKNIVVKYGKRFGVDMHYNLGLTSQNYIIKLFENWKPEAKMNDYFLYCNAVLAEVIKPDIDIEDNIYDCIYKNASSNQTNDSSDIIKMLPEPRNYTDLIKEFINLFLNNHIMNVDGLKKCVECYGDQVSRWLLDIDGYDYNLFDCNWLGICRPGLLRSISQNENAKINILKAYKKQYRLKNMSNRVNDIIIEYFISDHDEV